ncbi:hypothetical protein SAMN05421810_101727 [Amycolatopsis arida]|uniref:Uncharacterized protein n=1 Tax=Amycolatopsis arida TaxID=587909 RepID=A0A1I5LZ39_9PSEU|nr:hypothetical protein [Amycolatopsis arida]TDX93903.1 hypothetical protein CLV69_104360 [Amycolatopsis arida]SFP02480.1 hypothetical protein SAMN05421810_101727 [Amycolatopsis arida]
MREPDVDTAVDALAGAVSHALRISVGSRPNENFSLREGMPGWNGDGQARLAALRVLGADALAPFVLAGHTLADEDVDLVLRAMRLHPAPDAPDPNRTRLWALRDWAVISVLHRLNARPVPVPARPRGIGERRWQAWCAELVRLSSLALPTIDSPPRAEVATRRLDLDRGLTRALLRRDHLSAARLARWQALDHVEDSDVHLPSVLDHLTVLAGDRPRVRLEVTLAGLLMRRGR